MLPTVLTFGGFSLHQSNDVIVVEWFIDQSG